MEKKIAIIGLQSPLHHKKLEFPKYVSKSLNFLEHVPLLNKYTSFISKMQNISLMSQMTPYYLASLCEEYSKEKGIEVKIKVYDDYPKNIDIKDNYDLVLLSATTITAPNIYKISKNLKDKGIPTIIGGVHPTALPKEASNYANSIATGEGEITIPKILEDYFIKGKLKRIYQGSIKTSLDKLPAPAWNLKNPKDNWALTTFQTSRGCPHACKFCSTTSFQGAKRRHRPIEEIVLELEKGIENGSLKEKDTLFFTDNNITANPKYAKELFKALSDLRNKKDSYFRWVGQADINLAKDKDMIELLVKSGCITLLIGFESFVKEDLSKYGKSRNETEKYFEYANKIQKEGIGIVGSFVLGMEGQTYKSFRQIESFLKKVIDIPQVTILTPFPGTELYEELKKEKIIHKNYPEDWEKYDGSHVVIKPQCTNKKGSLMKPSELIEEYHKIITNVYKLTDVFKRGFRAMNRKGSVDTRNKWEKFKDTFFVNLAYRSLALNLIREYKKEKLSH